MNRLLAIAFCVAMAEMCFAQTTGQRLPTDIELRAMYCIRITQEFLAPMQSAQNPDLQANIDKAESTLQRLRLYMLPRMSELDLTSSAAAYAAGKNGYQEFNQVVGQCILRCGQNSQCLKDCGNSNTTVKRVQSCGDATFLPF